MKSEARNAPINGVTSKLTNVTYQEPPPGSNPVLRGVLLQLLSSILQASNFLQWLFWKNAGFSKLREIKELYNLEARYDPTVIPSASPRTQVESASHHAEKRLRRPTDYMKHKFYTIQDYHNAYSDGSLTPAAVAEVLLSMIQKNTVSASNHSSAFLFTNAELVRIAAVKSTQRFKAGRSFGLLDGVPVAVKDEVDVKGYPRCLGTKIQYADGSQDTSWCVRKWEDEGAVIIGKLSMHELGLDTTNNNPNYGTPLNPYNESYYTGGSSGGSGYVTAVGLVPFTLGADGGGSIRIPSTYCDNFSANISFLTNKTGIYGLKPSHGRVSIRPTPGLATSTGVTGPMAANMADLEVAYRVMAQPDSESQSSRHFTSPSSFTASREKPPIGIFKPWFDRAESSVLKFAYEALDYLRDVLGYEIIDITIPYIREGQMAHAMTIMSEILSATPPANIAQLTAPNRILMSVAKQHPASDLLLAQRLRGLIMSHLNALFEQYPGLIVVTPTTPNAGWHIEGGAADLKYGISDANMSVRSMEYVWLANFSGCPAICCPVGYAEAKGKLPGKIPVGIMGMTEWGGEDILLQWGYDLEGWINDVKGREMPPAWVDVLEMAKKWAVDT